jgi:hypothetical protein
MHEGAGEVWMGPAKRCVHTEYTQPPQMRLVFFELCDLHRTCRLSTDMAPPSLWGMM